MLKIHFLLMIFKDNLQKNLKIVKHNLLEDLLNLKKRKNNNLKDIQKMT